MMQHSQSSLNSEIESRVLVADIGGSNARFAWARRIDGAHQLEQIRSLRVDQFANLLDACQHYLAECEKDSQFEYKSPKFAAFAVATAVTCDQINFTNSHWQFSQAEIQAALGLTQLFVLNDFEALALSLPFLQASQIRSTGTLPDTHATLAVVGPGTGLGVAGVTKANERWIALPSEGGHASLAPYDQFESSILEFVRQRYSHVSAERLLSGIGLPLLYEAVCHVAKLPFSERNSESILELGLQNTDAACSKPWQCFVRFLVVLRQCRIDARRARRFVYRRWYRSKAWRLFLHLRISPTFCEQRPLPNLPRRNPNCLNHRYLRCPNRRCGCRRTATINCDNWTTRIVDVHLFYLFSNLKN